MSEPEILYSTTHRPDATNAEQVLAFMLVPDRVFLAPGDDAETVAAVHEVMTAAKRDVLLTWYAHAMRSGQ